MVGTLVSGSFLYVIAAINVVILVGIIRVFREMRVGRYDEAELEEQLDRRGLMNRVLGRLTRTVTGPRQMYPIGVLFGLGFDTATEVALLVLAGGAAGAGLPWYAVLCLPVLFAAGMSLMDSIDGSFMNFAYGWALSEPVRKVFYNLTITGLSVAVAAVIGTIELGGLLAVAARPVRWVLGVVRGDRPQHPRVRDRGGVRGHLGAGAHGVALRAHRGALGRGSCANRAPEATGSRSPGFAPTRRGRAGPPPPAPAPPAFPAAAGRRRGGRRSR